MKLAIFLVLIWGVGAQSTGTSAAASEITGCHFHESTQFCIDSSGREGSIVPAPTATSNAPTEYTGCHSHGSDTFCLTESGEEVQFVTEDSESSSSSSESSESSGSGSSGGNNCHFHAGVEHCIDEGESEHSSNTSCEKVDRDYNIPLRIGLLFVIFATSALAVFGPLVVRSLFKVPTTGVVFTVVKQFGTGVIISTAFVHLMTHASLMWENDCLGELQYEATGSAITMAGLFLAFTLEYLGCRLFGGHNHDGEVQVKDSGKNMESQNITAVNNSGILEPNSHVSVWTMEAGIVFHSILIGITLVVAGDSFFITLFIVILFHQMFEGLALGARIATLQSGILVKGIMGIIFSLITPVGMAIGIGVLCKFNGNDPSTIVALGTLDSFSAGVLLWTGLVEMWAFDWIHGYLSKSSWFITTVAFISLLAGMILMSVLGKWA